MINNEKLNSSGCLDKTAFEEIKNVRREERKRLIAEIKELAARYGYEIDCRIDLKEIKEVQADLGVQNIKATRFMISII